ncbi:MAG: ATP-binding protein [Syntrophaceae bacterium]|nr:ATP-binding protein [Syntrophaceae bacterium]
MSTLRNEDFKRLLDSIPCYITLQDKDLKILWSNEFHRRDFGEPEGYTCRDFYNIDSSKCEICPVHNTFLDGNIHSKEMTLITKKGKRINVIIYSSPLRDENGIIEGVLETAVNISPVKEIQKQLIMLGQTVAGMAHSIKNIMMGLDGGIYIVNRGLEDKNQKEVREGWEIVLLNFEKISQIVKDILYCSKEREPNFAVVSPNKIVSDIYHLFKDTAARYAIEFKLELDETIESAVLDPDGLTNVLSNLVSNAMDACKMDIMKDKHLIELRTKKGVDGATVFEVADNGVGIDKELKDQVFEEFFSSKGDKGTGLGLMVVQKIMREHGGRVTFRSRPRQGTTFVATFPKREMPQPAE